MCGFAAIGAVAGIIGGVVSGIGAAQQAEAQAQKDEYDAKVARINARTVMQQSIPEAEAKIAEYDRVQGTTIANAAKNGVDPYYGSAALIFAENESDKGVDLARIGENAYSRKVAYENDARGLEASAANHRQAGKIAMVSSFLGGLGSAAGSMRGSGGGVGSPLLIG